MLDITLVFNYSKSLFNITYGSLSFVFGKIFFFVFVFVCVFRLKLIIN